MKKISIYLMLFCYVFNIFHVSAASLEDSAADTTVETADVSYADPTETHGLDAVGAMLGTEKLVDNVRAAVLFEANSQTMMYAWNADTQMYPASLVKIMTALVALENGELSELVTVKEQTISSIPIDAVSAKLCADEVISLEELLYCLIVGSANDAAVVIADHISGSQQAFVSLMNQYAEDIGCTGTYFVNPHGLHDDNQHTTARDVARILTAAMENEQFSKIFTTVDHNVPATNKSEERSLSSGNSMLDSNSQLYYDPRVIGGRTGVTQDGRRCLASVSESNGMKMVSIVMGAESVYQADGYSAISIGGYQETSKLLDHCYDGYKATQILYPGQALRQMPISGGDSELAIAPQTGVTAVLPKNVLPSDLVLRYADAVFSAPVEKGQLVSNVQVWCGGVCVAQCELYALNSVAELTALSDYEEKNSIEWGVVVLVAVATAAVLAGLIVAYRYRRRIKRWFMLLKRRNGKPARRRRR